MITVEQFKKCFPANKEPQEWTDALNAVLPLYQINSGARIAHFLAQCGHESIGFTAVKENLNYSADALTATWPKRFPAGLAESYHRQPERIANRAYADRLGNGPEASGDGWRYRGRGVIQVTGKGNYSDFAKSAGKTLEDVVAYLETKRGAVESACWYWKTRGLNSIADSGDILSLTKRINGGTNGLEDRKARFAKITAVLTA